MRPFFSWGMGVGMYFHNTFISGDILFLIQLVGL